MSTLSCVLGAVWPAERQVVVAECDPSGGDLAGRFSLSARLGMTSLVLADRQSATRPLDYRAHTQSLPGGLDVLVAPAGADSATALDRELGLLPSDLISGPCDLIVDCGRFLSGAVGQEKMIREADRVLLLVRPDVTGVAHAQWAAGSLGQLSDLRVSAVIVGTSAFRSEELAKELGIKVLGTVAFDPRAAQMACGASGSSKAFIRSPLVASAREIVRLLLAQTPSSLAQTPISGGGDSHGRGSRIPRRRTRGSQHQSSGGGRQTSTLRVPARARVGERDRNPFR